MLKRIGSKVFGAVPAGPSEESPRRPMAFAVGLFCAAGGLSGYLLLPESQAHASMHVPITLGAETIAPSSSPKAVAMAAARAFLRTPITIIAGPWEFQTTRGQLGARVDLNTLHAWIIAARDPASPQRRFHAQEFADEPLALPVPASLDSARTEEWLLGVRDQVHQRMRDARIDLRTGRVLPGQAGMDLDVHGTMDALADALFTGTTTVQARMKTKPNKKSAKEIAGLDLSQVISSFETRYNTLDTDRSYNLRTAARHVDGVVLMPGEELDFNEVVGERSEANGFRPATVIADGELSDGVGGGTCQIAGTLHAASYFAGLPFLERNTHTRPSSYLKLGLDAVVAYPKLNLRLKNDLAHPIAFGLTVGAGRVRVEVRGPRNIAREVSFVRRVDEVTPYTEVTRADPSLPAGVKVLSQRGVPGFKLTSFRIVRDASTGRAVRERRTDSYPATSQIWRVGSGGAAPTDYVAPKHDAHGEYRTDEYLILTKPSGSDGVEQTIKRDGRTGAPGWTEREGMPQAP